MNEVKELVYGLLPFVTAIAGYFLGVMTMIVIRGNRDDRRDEVEAETHGDVPSLPEGWPGIKRRPVHNDDAEVAANFRAECERLQSLGFPITNTPRAGESDAQTAARARRG